VSVTGATGSLPAQQAVQVPVDLDASQLTTGTSYAAVLCVESNSPGSEALLVPVTLDVALPPAPPPVIAPDTIITKAPPRRIVTAKRKAKVTMGFGATLPGTFQCSIDGAVLRTCPATYSVKLGVGKHRILVRAVSVSGVPDPTPAVLKVKVKRKPKG
jgi:hypothetical protein